MKKQHFVPKGYLTNFAQKDKKIFVYDKFENRSFPTNINDIAQENCFYDLPSEIMDDKNHDTKIIEKILAEFDSIHAANLACILKRIKDKKRLFQEQKEKLADFVALQYLRTKDFRETSIECFEEMTEKIVTLIHKENTGNDIANQFQIKMKNIDHVPHHAKIMFDKNLIETLKNVLLSHYYLIGQNNTGTDFYVSDSPIILNSHNKDPMSRNVRGFLSPGIEILLPIANNYAISYFDKNYFPNLSFYNGNIIELKSTHIEYYNSLQVLEAQRYIYCRSNNFEFAKKVLQGSPDAVNPNRKKFSIS